MINIRPCNNMTVAQYQEMLNDRQIAAMVRHANACGRRLGTFALKTFNYNVKMAANYLDETETQMGLLHIEQVHPVLIPRAIRAAKVKVDDYRIQNAG